MNHPTFLIVDLFCGAGGTTTGFAQAQLEGRGLAKVIACVNHDPKAIKSHWMNHPEVKHFEEDIRTLDLTELVQSLEIARAMYPEAYVILWASLECTNFSKAKGGQPRDADSRTLADHLHRYVTALNPDYVQIENVVEFMSWGPLIAKPEKTDEGYLCCRFKWNLVEEIQYAADGHHLMECDTDIDEMAVNVRVRTKPVWRAVFHGVPESKKNGQDWMRWRQEICAHGYYDEWKELNSANFGAYTSRNRLFGCFAKDGLPIIWPKATHAKNPVPGSMFDSELQRWKAVKDVLDFSDEGESIFSRSKPLSEKTLERIYAGLVKYVAKGDTSFISKYYSGKPSGKNIPVDGPAGTVTTIDSQALVESKFLTHYYGSGGQHSSIENPAPVIPTKARTALVQPEHWKPKHNESDNEYWERVNRQDSELNYSPIKGEPFIMPTSHDNPPKSIEEPAPTLLASRRHHYIVNPSHGGHSTSTDAPCPVIVARQDKAPLYLVQCEAGDIAIAVYAEDSECTIRIKQFMAAFRLVDIKMRMLRVHELLKIQGFPADFQLFGNQSDQKKFIGNSVVPHVVKAWCEAFGAGLIDYKQQKVA